MTNTLTWRMPLILAGFGLAPTSALAEQAEPAPEAAAEPSLKLKALADSCAAHKFETIVTLEGRKRGSRVRICGEPGQSDASWLNTLRSSIKQTQANDTLAQPVKDQIVSALNAEIERLESIAAPAAAAPASSTLVMSAEPVAPPEPAPQYSLVPPLPAPKPRVATAASASASTAPVVKPRLTLRCALPRESFAGCSRLQRETQVLVRADEDLAEGTRLRFLRGGDQRAEIDLGPLRKGDSWREKLPGRVCSGVLRGKVEVQVLSKNQVADTLGPFALYCGS
jgi:hypothetical protein